MNVYASYTSITESFTFSSAPTVGSVTAVLYYEYDQIVGGISGPSLVSGSTYSINITEEMTKSSGLYKIKWGYTIAGVNQIAYSEFKIEDPYLSVDKFLTDFPVYDEPEFISRFSMAEKTARRIIDTHTGQSFQLVQDKERSFAGNNRNEIYLLDRLISYSSVFIDESDYTANVMMDLRSRYFLKLTDQYPYPDSRRDDLVPAIFPKKTIVKVTGDWGWITAPWEIQQAAELLIVDLLDDTRREHHRYGISRLEQGNNRLEFDKSLLNSTGNIDVDTLLMDYVHWTMDYVY
jgi:hypothetical protein